MNNDFRRKMNEQLSKDAESRSGSSKEKIWSRLDINHKVETSSSLLWKVISAILLLLLMSGTACYYYDKKVTSNLVMPVQIPSASDTLELQMVQQENRKLQKAIMQLNSEMATLKEQIRSVEISEEEAEIRYVEKVVYLSDTVLVRSDPITIYKDVIVRDTLYIPDSILETEPVAGTQSPLQEERIKTSRSVQFDLRNQVKKEPSKTKNKSKGATYLGIK